MDVPFAIADAQGSASLQPVLSLNRDSRALPSLQSSAGVTKGSIGDIYVEPVNFGWHLRQLDAIVSSGFFAPSGPYKSDTAVNIGYGHWTGVFGLGGIAYADAERTGRSPSIVITCCTAHKSVELYPGRRRTVRVGCGKVLQLRQ